jgi:hypothetical protein
MRRCLSGWTGWVEQGALRLPTMFWKTLEDQICFCGLVTASALVFNASCSYEFSLIFCGGMLDSCLPDQSPIVCIADLEPYLKHIGGVVKRLVRQCYRESCRSLLRRSLSLRGRDHGDRLSRRNGKHRTPAPRPIVMSQMSTTALWEICRTCVPCG